MSIFAGRSSSSRDDGYGGRQSYPSGARNSYLSETTTPTNSDPKNPDPKNYQIVKALERNGFLVVIINYPDCTNYEGNKILLFKNLTLLQLVNQKVIDPHFFQDDKFASPVARFVPTDEGWAMALSLMAVRKKR
jgi:hypothetical protein